MWDWFRHCSVPRRVHAPMFLCLMCEFTAKWIYRTNHNVHDFWLGRLRCIFVQKVGLPLGDFNTFEKSSAGFHGMQVLPVHNATCVWAGMCLNVGSHAADTVPHNGSRRLVYKHDRCWSAIFFAKHSLQSNAGTGTYAGQWIGSTWSHKFSKLTAMINEISPIKDNHKCRPTHRHYFAVACPLDRANSNITFLYTRSTNTNTRSNPKFAT